MRLQRGKEEISICKIEVANYLRYLGETITTLEGEIRKCKYGTDYDIGKMILMRIEVEQLRVKIHEARLEFQLSNLKDIRSFFAIAETSVVTEVDSEAELSDASDCDDPSDQDNTSLYSISEEESSDSDETRELSDFDD